MNYFELFNIEQNYIIGLEVLQKKYFSMQAVHHPDRAKTSEQRLKNLEYSILINEAYNILKDHYLRAEYMLKLKGRSIDETSMKNLLSSDELEKILAQYEQIENTNEIKFLSALQQEKIAEQEKLIHHIGLSFIEDNIEQALDLTVRLKYLTNLVRNIKLKIKNANS